MDNDNENDMKNLCDISNSNIKNNQNAEKLNPPLENAKLIEHPFIIQTNDENCNNDNKNCLLNEGKYNYRLS